ncbi:MAG: signal recognition particle protein [Propionibacteriaceae bacterium]|jgi:signal recognition particle subunit SRP54|nr:signal recognition particle protein [Propionibacteriaceae bacterium]
MFDTLQDRLAKALRNLRGKGKLSDADIEATLGEIRIALLEADVNLEVVKEFVGAIRQRAAEVELSKAINPAQQIVKLVHEQLVAVLGGETRNLQFAKHPPTVIMLAGLQGSGKTTLAGKLAWWLREQGNSPLLVAADLQRPNAVTQLQVVGEQAKVAVYAPQPGNGVGDPVAVARDAIGIAKHHLHDVVIVDTAGRLGVDEVMLKQAADIRAAISPDETLFVVDAMIGQDAVVTARSFADQVGFDGVVLTKLDGDARGGAALSVATVTGVPIMFASTGEKLTDFEVFHPDRMAGRILDMGDMLTLIEQAERHFDKREAEEAAGKLLGGRGQFTLQDFLTQMQAVRRMGSITKLMGMLPGAGAMADQLSQVDDKQINRIEAIIYSMTPAERADVAILNGSRRARIAKGAGVEVSDVNGLVTRFTEARKMMAQLGSGMGMPGAPAGAMGFPSMRRAQAAKKKKTGSRVSGNPAKRAGVTTPAKAEPQGFDLAGMSNEELEAAMQDFQLPPDIARALGGRL